MHGARASIASARGPTKPVDADGGEEDDGPVRFRSKEPGGAGGKEGKATVVVVEGFFRVRI